MDFLSVENVASEQVRTLLMQNVIGTPGKSMVYQHLRVSDKLEHIQNAKFVSLKLRNKLLGTSCFIYRTNLDRGLNKKAVYIRYFAFKDAFRSSTIRRLKRVREDNPIKTEVKQLLNNGCKELGVPEYHYAYLDPGNIRSRQLASEFGFQPVGTFRTVFLSRFLPRKNRNVRQITRDELNTIHTLLKKQFKSHIMFTLDNIGINDGYYVYEKDGEFIAGIQANAEKWRVFELPGGKFLLNIISNVPVLNRIFSKNFRFLSLEAAFVREGEERTLQKLIEDVLARKRRHTAVICLDPQSSLYDSFQKLSRGWMSVLAPEKELEVVMHGSEEDILNYASKPVYVSAFDNM